MKTLILSCNTGGGHNTAAKALCEVLKNHGDDCEIKDALAFGGQKASDLVCDSYLEIVKRTPKMFGEIYKLGGKVGQFNASQDIKSPVYLVNRLYAKDLKEYIVENGFDAVICTHIFPLEAMTHLKRHGFTVPVFFISTDYACCPLLEETDADVIFSPHKDSEVTFAARNIPMEKVVSSGIPVAQKFTVPADKAAARAKLGFAENEKIALIMSGSMGFGDAVDTAGFILADAPENTKVVVIAGNNKEMIDELEKRFKNEKRLVSVGFTDQVAVYMDAADVLLTKPGGLTSTEALVKCIPIIHTSPIPGCETENAEFFTQHHLSLCAQDSATAAILAKRLLTDDFLREQIVSAQKHYRYENSAGFIVDFIRKRLENM